MTGIFSFEDYRQYIKSTIQTMPKQGRGFRTRMAGALNCQTAYISQVLNGSLHLTLEQALKLSRLMAHTEEEKNYFLLLIEHERAGSKELKDHFEKQLNQSRSKQLLLRERFKTKTQMSESDKMIYYSDWQYAAIHMMITIPEFQTPSHLARALEVPEASLKTKLEFLEKCGLASMVSGRWKPGQRRIHLGSDSPLVSKHHLNWRVYGMRTLDDTLDQDLHYTSIVTLSRADAERLKVLWVEAMNRHNKLVEPSPEEVCYALVLDFFEIS
jgi:uncharacterized protein (TIGR02147 family)